jgi:DNA-binding NarL/FixJ family response regulator
VDRPEVLVSAREPARADELARELAARELTVEITKTPQDRLLERRADDRLAAAVIDNVTDAPLLGVIADATAARPRLAVVVLGPTVPNVDALIALASGASAYLSPDTSAAAVADATAAVLAGQVVLPPAISAALVRGLQCQGRGVVVDAVDGSSIVLTHREWDVLVQLRQGRTTAEIAQRFVVSAGTVRTHVGSIVRKLGVDGRAAISG